MRSNICLLLALGLAVAQAVPASRIEKKSMEEASDPLASDMKLEETGDDNDRSKKSTSFCLDIKDNNQQQAANAVQMVPVQAVNLVPQVQQPVMVPTQMAQPMQTVQVVQQPQPCQQPSSFNIITPQVQNQVPVPVPMPAPAPRPIQPPVQAVAPTQMVQPLHTVQIVQQPQPCQQPTSFNIITPQVQNQAPEPVPVPAPAPRPIRPPVEVVTARPKPQRVIAPEPLCETNFETVPVPPVYKEQVMVVPQKVATLIKVPQCAHAQQGVQCNCRQQGPANFRRKI